MGEIVEPRTLSGFMELLPKDQVIFEKIKSEMEKVYQKYGFFPLDTPVLEDSRILLAKAGGETEKQIYRFNKGDTDLTMRFDLTVPLAKYVAKNYSELTFPFRRYQIGKVYRGERAQKGRFREFYQADIDIVGDGSLSIVNDAEIPSIIYNLFKNLGIEDFVIRINNRKVLNGLFDNFGVKESAVDILRIIDKIDKIGRDNVAKELVELNVPETTVNEMLDILTFDGSNEEKVARLKSFAGCNEVFDAGLEELTTVIGYIAGFGVPSDYYKIDLSIARGLDYYTGTVYETFIKNHPEYGSVCSGGRYDNLAGYYTKKSLPGVGISIGLTRLFYVLCENDFLNRAHESQLEALVIPMTEDMNYAVKTATELRRAGINTQIYLEEGKFKKKLTYGSRLTIPFCVILGSDEIEAGHVTIKNMSTGDQKTTDLQEAVAIINSYKDMQKKIQYVNMH
ncbi:histidine--tRNA ligase [Firmicutes bacterium CAG:882]|nr:histidine--tRNA ligase [Firmicutes bacterium CAG:882]